MNTFRADNGIVLTCTEALPLRKLMLSGSGILCWMCSAWQGLDVADKALQIQTSLFLKGTNEESGRLLWPPQLAEPGRGRLNRSRYRVCRR